MSDETTMARMRRRQERMITQQVVERGIDDPALLAALRHVKREDFFPEELRTEAFADRAAPIGCGQTISQPYMVALMTQRLELDGNQKVLEIGTGSGYQTAILAQLAREVYTIERLKPLLDEAFERLMRLGFRNIHWRYGDGTDGWPAAAPFDRILITAGAPETPRQLLMEQLADGGVAVVPVGPQTGQTLMRYRRTGDELAEEKICACRFVPLIGRAGWPSE